MSVQVKTSASVSGSLIRLSDLRALVEATKLLNDNVYVSISVNAADYGQGDYYTISVSG